MKTFMEGIVNKFKGLSKASKVGLIGIVVGGVIIAGSFLNEDLADVVKDGTFYRYPSQRIGETFDTAFGTEGKWISYEEERIVIYEVKTYEHNLVLKFTFKNPETEEFTLTNVYVDGIDYSYNADIFITEIFSDPTAFRNYLNEYYYYN